MTRPSVMSSGAVLARSRAAWSIRVRAAEPDLLLRIAAVAGLALTLASTPFEGLVIRSSVAGFLVTELELAWAASLAAWLGLLARERRAPAIPRSVWVTVGALAMVSFASALLSGPGTEAALRFALRGAAFWAIFLAAADLVRTERTAAGVVGLVLLGASVAAALGWLGHLRGTSEGLFGLGRDFTVAGQLRVTGPYDYPNTAAMAWEASLLVSLPLVLIARQRWAKLLVAVGLFLVGGAMILTFSRGALLGALAGLGVLSLLAVLARRPRPALLAVLTGSLLVGGMVAAQLGTAIPIARLTVEGDRDLYGATYVAPPVVEVAPGGRVTVPVTVTNVGAAPWPASGEEPFRLSYHWMDATSGSVTTLDGVRTRLPRTLGPGERVEVDAMVIAPLEPGRHILAWDVVHEGVAWLSEKGVPAWATTVSVGHGAATDTAPPAAGAVQVWPELVPVPSRAELWAAAAEMIRQQPLLGVGPGNYRLTYGAYLGWERWDDRIHANDLYLELAATIGLIGLACFLALVGVVMVRSLRDLAGHGTRERPGEREWLIRAGIVAALVAFLAHGIVDYFLAFAPTGLLFWAFLGMALGLGVAKRHSRAGPDAVAASQPAGQAAP